MKRCFILIAAILLFATAIAYAVPSGPVCLAIRDYSINPQCDTFACKMDGETFYRLIDGQGNVIVTESARYTNISRMHSSPFFKVEVKSTDGVHDEGLIDSQGNVIVPSEYADIKVISDRWQAGIRLTSSSAEDKDYTFTNWSTNEKTFYRIDSVDFYFDGVKAGTLNRSQYGDGSNNAYGAYLLIRDIEKQYKFYNSKMELSPYQATVSGEYDSIYKNRKTTVYHQGSGQKAFDPSCTLDQADLENPYRYDSGVMYDLQGNVLFKTKQNYDSVQRYNGDYAIVKMNRKSGLIDMEGNEIIPVEYDNLGNYEGEFLKSGYISAVKDEKFGFLDAHGNVTCDFVYSNEIVRNYSSFATVKNLDGTIIVLSAAAGELPEHYAEVYFPSSDNPMGFVGINSDNQKCVVNLYGNTVIPYSDDYSSIEINNDLSVIVCQQEYKKYDLFSAPVSGRSQTDPASTVDIPVPSLEELFVPANPVEEVDLKPTVVTSEDAWTCENGHAGNTGKFCSECGAPRPALDEGTWTCENGHAGNTGKFCSECGAPKPEMKDEDTWTCENGHAGNTGKFCSECGAPKPVAGQEAPTDRMPETPVIQETNLPAEEEAELVNPFPKGFERFTTPLAGTYIDHKIALDEVLSHAKPTDDYYMTYETKGIASRKFAWVRYGNAVTKLYIIYNPNETEVYAYALACEYPVSRRQEWAEGKLSPNEINTIGSILWVEAGEDNDTYLNLLEKGKNESDYESAKKQMRSPNLYKSCLWFSHRLTYGQEEIDRNTDRYWVVFHNTPD